MGIKTATIRVVHQGGDRLLIETRGHQVRSDQPVEDGGDDTAPIVATTVECRRRGA
jgi:hypothetical protein